MRHLLPTAVVVCVAAAARAVAGLKTAAAGQGVDVKERSAPIPGT